MTIIVGRVGDVQGTPVRFVRQANSSAGVRLPNTRQSSTVLNFASGAVHVSAVGGGLVSRRVRKQDESNEPDLWLDPVREEVINRRRRSGRWLSEEEVMAQLDRRSE